MNMKSTIKKFKRLFDWTPVDVSEPFELYQDYKDQERFFLGYQVTVNYKYHGTKSYLFAVDENKFFLASRGWALKRAIAFSKQIKQQVLKCRDLQYV